MNFELPVALCLAASLLQSGCIFLSANARAAVELKNRTALPQPADFDPSITLDALLQPGDDSARWSVTRAAAIEGYVVRIDQAGIEAANRFSLTRRDVHIEIATRPDAPPRARVILEVTPPMRDWAKTRGIDWSTDALRRTLLARRCRFEGWLFFDRAHADEAENTNPGGSGNWRATAWEIHPVTAIEVIDQQNGETAKSREKGSGLIHVFAYPHEKGSGLLQVSAYPRISRVFGPS